MTNRAGGGEQLSLPIGRLLPSTRSLRLRAIARSVMTDRLPLGDAHRYVALIASTALTSGTFDRYTAIWRNFETFAMAVAGVDDVREVDQALARRFVAAKTTKGRAAPNTMRLRCSALRYLFRILRAEGLVDADPTLDLVVPAIGVEPVRPLTDAAIERCRWAAGSALHAAPRYTATLAVMEAGASTGEVGELEWTSVADDGSTVRIEGQRTPNPRLVVPTAWGAAALAAARGEAVGERVAVLRSSSYNSARTAVTHVLREIFERAGVDAEPRSITAWSAARIVEDTGRIELAARAIGFESLDRTADLIGFDWRGAPAS